MKKIQTIFLAIFVIVFLFSCSTKLSHDEYYAKAKKAYTEGKFKEAVESFKLLIEYYPDGEKAAEASFMLGFINANDLKDFAEAEKYYKAFIEKYPKHDLADDAQYELKFLGKDINELPMFGNLGADSTDNE